MGRTANYSRQSCSIAASLEVIGDPWTLLVIRDAFLGVTRFEQWQEHLGIARNVLAARLKSLVCHGILEQKLYSERPVRHEYVLTAKGRDLSAVLITLYSWGRKYLYGDEAPAVDIIHRPCGHELEPVLTCGHCSEPVRRGELEILSSEKSHITVGEILAREIGQFKLVDQAAPKDPEETAPEAA